MEHLHDSQVQAPRVSRDYDALALGLLAPHLHDPAPRARRIAAIYASLYLEDPLLHQWCGLAAFVARHVSMGLETGLGPLQAHFAEGNLAIYRDIVPAFLRFRDRAPVPGKLGPGFALLNEADEVALDDLPRAEALAQEALWLLSCVEQTDICQPVYDRMGWWGQRLLSPFVLFRFGYDTAAPVVKFDGDRPSDLSDRLLWMEREVMPAWRRYHGLNSEHIRADLDRIRRDGDVRVEHLPRVLAI